MPAFLSLSDSCLAAHRMQSLIQPQASLCLGSKADSESASLIECATKHAYRRAATNLSSCVPVPMASIIKTYID
jgi:hypothetical protein